MFIAAKNVNDKNRIKQINLEISRTSKKKNRILNFHLFKKVNNRVTRNCDSLSIS